MRLLLLPLRLRYIESTGFCTGFLTGFDSIISHSGPILSPCRPLKAATNYETAKGPAAARLRRGICLSSKEYAGVLWQ